MVKSPPPYAASADMPRRHTEYYLEGGNLVIQVDTTLFRVWSTTFRKHSKLFDVMLRPSPISEATSVPDGTNDEHPFRLQDLKPWEFERFLWVLYPPAFGKHRARTASQWITILELSHRWDFEDVHKLAIKKLSEYEVEAAKKIALQQKYQIEKQWAYTSYIDLCSREFSLTRGDAEQLGTETTAQINKVRERLTAEGRAKPGRVAIEVCWTFELKDPNQGCTIQ